MQNVIINQTNDETSVYILENNKLCEMYCYRKDIESTLGNIYNGKVTDIVNGMQAAFINLGLERNAFISVKDALKKVDVAKEEQDTNLKMSDVLKVGQNVLVQVKKEPTDGKGARVSTHITLPGKYIVLMPGTDILTVSQKIEDEAERERLKQIISRVLPGEFGAIIRTDAINASEEALTSDVASLFDSWNDILEKASQSDDVGILYDDHDIVERTIRDAINQNTQKVYVNSEVVYSRVCSALGDERCILDKDADLVSKFGLEAEIARVQNRKVYLNCGGHIVIDKTEALTAIDVNSGKYTGSKDLESTTLKVNLEAATEIMRQIRLKDIGGIVVVDFIDMHTEENKNKIIELMRKEAKKDRSKVDVRDFTQLNLVELTRKKMYV
ncbi:MAG: Rne/Rng family ribonuclease [Clostridia bacterium]|nr:Rne/Rng family ribonuclease [Clostridia bacterium]